MSAHGNGPERPEATPFPLARPTNVGRMSPSAKAAAALPVRSLADDLRVRSDDALTALLSERPDLTHPVPSDLGALAVRAAVGVSVARALDRLDRFGLDVVDALAVLPDPTSSAHVAALVG